ncbi:hypothetical protein [Amycolatopsis anabasis]|uniref:hypothetical protein n=1 Tax=Amycolatopsis anabasis TaxID=1840409 RepID=UPI00131E3DB4|nr:hypothetical protein [Amycolatopsis anabasis]
MTHAPRPLIALAAGLATLFLVAGCDGGGYGSSGTGGHSPGQAVANTAAEDQSGLNAVRAFDIGRLVVDAKGLTVYRFDKDTAKPPKSNCEGDCAVAWPPVLATSDLKLNGIDGNLVGSVSRSDGTEQVTLAGWPLYRHNTDQMPGETSGQGADGAWYPITPEGKKVQSAESPGDSGEFGL